MLTGKLALMHSWLSWQNMLIIKDLLKLVHNKKLTEFFSHIWLILDEMTQCTHSSIQEGLLRNLWF